MAQTFLPFCVLQRPRGECGCFKIGTMGIDRRLALERSSMAWEMDQEGAGLRNTACGLFGVIPVTEHPLEPVLLIKGRYL